MIAQILLGLWLLGAVVDSLTILALVREQGKSFTKSQFILGKMTRFPVGLSALGLGLQWPLFMVSYIIHKCQIRKEETPGRGNFRVCILNKNDVIEFYEQEDLNQGRGA